MSSDDWVDQIDDVIWERAKDYVARGRVLAITQDGDGVYRADVQGTDVYAVLIQVDRVGHVKMAQCTCPYDQGPVCKHKAAVWLSLSSQRSKTTAPGHTSRGAKSTLRNLLAQQSREWLIDYLATLAEESEVITQQLQFALSQNDLAGRVAEARRLIQAHIASQSDRHGFVDYRHVASAVSGAETVMQTAWDENPWPDALHLSFCVLEEMLDMLDAADDSDGTIGGVIMDSLDRIDNITQSVANESAEDRAELLRLLLEKSGDPRLEGWSGWQLQLLRAALHLADTLELKEAWDRRVATLSCRQETDWGRNYWADQIAIMERQWILDHQGPKAAGDYVHAKLAVPKFRQMAIESAMSQRQYDEADRLAAEGEAFDRERSLPGLVRQWQELRYRIALASGHVDLQRAVARQLVENGEFPYYRLLKESYPSEEWPTVYHDLIQSLQNQRPIYAKILLEEHDTVRLMAYVEMFPLTIEAFYPHLINSHRDKVISLLQQHIKSLASRSNTRAHYQKLAQLIATLDDTGASLEARALVHELTATYAKKRALHEELRYWR